MCVKGGCVIEINGVRSEGAIRTAEGSRETLLVGPASPEPTRGLCLIRPVNLRDRGHRHTLIRPDGSSVAGQMSAIFILFLHLSKKKKHTHTGVITEHFSLLQRHVSPPDPKASCLAPLFIYF